MPIKHFRPLTPSQRFTSLNKHVGLSKNRPQKALTEPKHKTGGRNAYGRLTSRRMGGGHKQLYRIIDFKRDIFDIPAVVEAIEYDPNRSAHIALLAYTNGVKRYIPAPEGLKAGDRIVSANTATTNDFTVGNCFPLGLIPPSTRVHCVEMVPGKGAQMARSAGVSIELVAVEHGNAQLKMPSGEIRLVNAKCRATIGVVAVSYTHLGDRVRSQPLRAHRAPRLHERRQALHPGPRRPEGGRPDRLLQRGDDKRLHGRQLLPSGNHSPVHPGALRGDCLLYTSRCV